MVQREIKGTDLESICLERFFFSIGGYLLKRIGDLRAVSVDD